jgi:hypothetical protein
MRERVMRGWRGSEEDGKGSMSYIYNMHFSELGHRSFGVFPLQILIHFAITGNDCGLLASFFLFGRVLAVTHDPLVNHALIVRAGKPAATRMQIPASMPRHLGRFDTVLDNIRPIL